MLCIALGSQSAANAKALGQDSAALDRPVFAAGEMANVSLNVPASARLGQDVTFSVTFDNASTVTGFGPFIEIFLDRTGADGVYPGTPAPANTYDGLSTSSTVTARYLGSTISSADVFVLAFNASGHVTHPFLRDGAGNFVTLNGSAANRLIVIRLPFGSFTPDQPAAAISVTVNMSNLADVGTPLGISARGGYQFDTTPLDDWCCGDSGDLTYGTTAASSVTPVLFTVTKAYLGPEDETASGPNFQRSYTLRVDIAPGQTITNLVVSDPLPDNIQYVSASSIPAYSSITEPSTITPGGTLSLSFASLSTLSFGDEIIVHLSGQKYVYEVRENLSVSVTSVSVLRHEEYPWLTLITCKSYDAQAGSYRYCTVVRAVLISIEPE